MEHINKFPVYKSHYSRNQITLKKSIYWLTYRFPRCIKLYVAKRKAANLSVENESTYRKIFVENFIFHSRSHNWIHVENVTSLFFC